MNTRKNAFLALIMTAIPGLGHFYLERKIRAIIYAFSIIGILGFSFFLMVAGSEEAGEPGAILAVMIWLASGLDMIFTLVSGGARRIPSQYAAAGVPGYGEVSAGGELQEPSASFNGASLQYPQRTGADERFFTILLSFIPGLGHFQLGLMQRGLTLLIGFFGLGIMVIFVSVLTNVEGFLVFLGALPVIWFYSMFDAVQLLHRKQRGEVLVDRTILEDLDHHREAGRKSKVVATLLSIFPGAGHLYLGLQRRGLQFMAFFLLSVYVLDLLRLSLFLFLIPIIWFYSFFDALQQVSRYQANEPLKDVPLVEGLMNHQRWIGIGLLVLGGFYLLDHVLVDLLVRILDNNQIYVFYNQYFQTTLVSLLLMAGGIKLLFGGKKKGADPS
ncbi:hypothetical protein SY83_03700 [Paenibacillus swuensis]|uniref:Multi-TM2 domain-containing protein n=1 Tax=Paenibacillus swuensis TaxID=1178515 RepID=A0A172TF99_9BACL|nr:hypothetical protein [Paenibacillus swuensis]ANE45557.1 hypothetical protein SY83_03700 [Paenibacillus swuensis]